MLAWKALWCWSGRKSWFSLTSYEMYLRRDRIVKHPTSFNVVCRKKTVRVRFAVSSSCPLSLPAVKTIDDERATCRAIKIHRLNITTAKTVYSTVHFLVFLQEYWDLGKIRVGYTRRITNIYVNKMRKTIADLKLQSGPHTDSWAPHACQCSVQLFILSGNDFSYSQKFTFARNFQVPKKNSKISQSQQNSIDLVWTVSGTVERSYCMLRTLSPCFGRQTKLWTCQRTCSESNSWRSWLHLSRNENLKRLWNNMPLWGNWSEL